MAQKRVPQVMTGRGVEHTATETFRRHLSRLSADSLFRLGNEYLEKAPAQPDSALLCFLTVIQRGEGRESDEELMREVAKSYVNASHVYTMRFHDALESYRLLRKAEKICLDNDFDRILCYVYLNISTAIQSNQETHAEMRPGEGGNEESLAYLFKAYDLAERCDNREVMGFSVLNMITGYSFDKEQRIVGYIKRYVDTPIEPADTSAPYVIPLCRGALALIDRNVHESLRQFRLLYDRDTGIKTLEPRMLEIAKIMEALAYEVEGNWQKGVELNTEIYQESLKSGDKEMSLWAAGNIHLIYDRAGKSEEADRWLLTYCKIQNELARINSGSTIKEFDLRVEIDDYKSDLEKVSRKERRQRYILIAGSVMSMLVIIILTLVVIYSRRRRRDIMNLYSKNIELLEARRSLDSPTSNTTSPSDGVAGEQLPEEHSPSSDTGSTPSQATIERERKERELERKVKEVLASREVFDPDFQLSRLCTAVDSNPTYVARAINNIYGKTFKTVVTELRIAEACRRFDNPDDNRRYTVEAICGELGFKSRAAFSVAFKSVTGLTPTEYRRAARRYMPPQS